MTDDNLGGSHRSNEAPKAPPSLASKALVVAGIIIGPDSRVLAARRTGPANLAGLWEFPGGKVEPGETWAQGLVRELLEELSLAVNVGRTLHPPPEIATPQGFWPISSTLEMAALCVTSSTTAVKLTPAHDTHSWCSVEELSALAWVPADRPVVELLSLLDIQHRT